MSRLNNVASAHQLLIAESWAKAAMQRIIADAVEGCGGNLERFDIQGRDFDVRAATAVSISLAIHELCTNAYKYGSLSVPDGRVAIRWGIVLDPGPIFQFQWKEIGGPRISTPEQTGFGSKLLTRGIQHETGGQVTMDFHEEGLVYTFRTAIAAEERVTTVAS